MMALYVASHYRNAPNDLILMSDAPAHHLFALLGPLDESKVSCQNRLQQAPISFYGQCLTITHGDTYQMNNSTLELSLYGMSTGIRRDMEPNAHTLRFCCT